MRLMRSLITTLKSKGGNMKSDVCYFDRQLLNFQDLVTAFRPELDDAECTPEVFKAMLLQACIKSESVERGKKTVFWTLKEDLA